MKKIKRKRIKLISRDDAIYQFFEDHYVEKSDTYFFGKHRTQEKLLLSIKSRQFGYTLSDIHSTPRQFKPTDKELEYAIDFILKRRDLLDYKNRFYMKHPYLKYIWKAYNFIRYKLL